MFLNAYLKCLRFRQGSTIKRIVQFKGLVSGRVQSGGVSLRTIQLGGTDTNGKIPFPLMKKGDRFIRCRIEILGEREQRNVDRGRNPRRV
jgi:hypothetical protein